MGLNNLTAKLTCC